MSDRLREILSKCFITANSTPDGNYFVQIDLPTLHEMQELHREIVTFRPSNDESENDLGKVDNEELLTWAAVNIDWDDDFTEFRSEANHDPFFSCGTWYESGITWVGRGSTDAKTLPGGIRTKHQRVITFEEWQTARSHYLAIRKQQLEQAPRLIPAAEFREAFAPEPEWRPMETAPQYNQEWIEIINSDGQLKKGYWIDREEGGIFATCGWFDGQRMIFDPKYWRAIDEQ